MVAVRIRVDNREGDLFSQLERIYSSKSAETEYITIIKEPLLIGDVILEDIEQKVQLVFERKTFQDLAASIKDGRYKEQKARLLSNYSPSQITYILEDTSTYRIWCSNSSHFFGMSKSVYQGVIINSLYRDKIRIYTSKDTEETAQFLWGITKKLSKDITSYLLPQYQRAIDNQNQGEGDGGQVEGQYEKEERGVGGSNGSSYIDYCQIKDRKIENITPKTAFMLQLGQIPGISRILASNIAEKYSTMRELIQKLESLGDDSLCLKELERINLIGKKKALIILQYLGFGLGSSQ